MPGYDSLLFKRPGTRAILLNIAERTDDQVFVAQRRVPAKFINGPSQDFLEVAPGFTGKDGLITTAPFLHVSVGGYLARDFPPDLANI